MEPINNGKLPSPIDQLASELADSEENVWTAEMEREATSLEYPCPDHLWQGLFSEVAERLNTTSWEIWMGAACAFGAVATRRIHAQYYGPLYGQFYGLLVKPTGTGKSVCTNTFRALLPDTYSISGAVQSGPALMPIVASVVRDKDGHIESVFHRPSALIIPEWTRLAKNLKIQHATLLEDLNEIADGIAWNISRSEANKNGGGNVVLRDPILTICATTTSSLFKEEVTSRMIQSGFVNRYLILPGSFTRWKLYDPDAAAINFPSLNGLLDHYWSLEIGHGRGIWECYQPSARERFLAWGVPLFEGLLMNATDNATEIYKRLHTYAHRLCLLYAWATTSQSITLPHVEAAISVIDTSKRFLEALSAEVEPYLMPSVRFDIEGKEKVAQKIQRESGKVDLMKLSQDLRKSMRSKDIRRWVDELMQEGYIKKTERRWLTWKAF